MDNKLTERPHSPGTPAVTGRGRGATIKGMVQMMGQKLTEKSLVSRWGIRLLLRIKIVYKHQSIK